MSAPRSLRRLLTAGSFSIGAITLVLIAVLVVLFGRTRVTFEEDRRASVIEQRGADEITTGVYGQLLEVFRQLQSPSPSLARFDSLGSVAYARLRTYLKQDMDTRSRLQVEEINELHRTLEVQAHTALEVARRGDPATLHLHIAQMETQASKLEQAINQFVAFREGERNRLHNAQASALERTVWAIGVAVAALVILTLVFMHAVQQRVLAPLLDLSNAAIRLGHGDLSARVAPQRHAELANVADSFNDMAVKIRDANTARAQSEVKYRRLFDEAPVPLYRTSPEGLLLDANPALGELLGLEKLSDVIGQPVQPWYVDANDREVFNASMSARGAIHGQLIQLRKANGDGVWVLDTTRSVVDPETGATSYEGGLLDLTERLRAEAALRESEERFREMADHIKEAFFIVDLSTFHALYVSPTWSDIWKRPLSDGYDPNIWLNAIHPEDRAEMIASQQKVKGGTSDESVFRVLRPDQSVRWVRARAFPVRNAAGEVYRLVGVAEDITELRQVEERFTQAQKMEAVGRLAGGVAHDFNNLLTVIIAQAEILQNELKSDPSALQGILEIRRACDSAVGLTAQLLAFSRKQLIEPVVFSLSESVAETAKMLRRLIGEDITLEVSLSTDASIRADRGQIQQVLTNLAVNSRDAMPLGGTLTIATRLIKIRENDVLTHPDVAVGDYIQLSVSDTGCGMTEEVRARAFEPFFTTKERGKGTGLGLATSHGIIRQAGGSIAVYSEPGVGTTFRIYLPVVAGVAMPKATPHAVPAQIGTETVLMVEDEPAVRRVGARLIRSLGYTVLEACDAMEALRILADPPQPIQLLFTDTVLPVMGGRELADRVKENYPEIKILFTSGYTDDVILQHKLASNDVLMVQKPYSKVTLAQKIRAALEAGVT